MKLLLIEDVPPLAHLTREALETEGFTVDHAANLESARAIVSVAPPDVIVLDLGLPDGDGLDLLHGLRNAGNAIPVLVVTARAGLNDRIDGLDRGADDYIVKPAAPAEIAARCRALLRRPGGLLGRKLQLGNLAFDTASRSVTAAGRPVALARREIDVLEVLLRKLGQSVPRRVIEDAIYTLDEAPGPNALEASVSRLRRQLADVGANVEIHTIRGIGYLITEAGGA
ncbi:response regulator transcription factor [Rhabdaerophilum sp. SD176]|uniref:response regulator n=1 Tax=Rhabdaerophilum sp. SD176 TaxID=2983548 RepID=UPI0024DF94ED|nr:response regulator transcription factor [Rhabdaerophilum sp. SD176]